MILWIKQEDWKQCLIFKMQVSYDLLEDCKIPKNTQLMKPNNTKQIKCIKTKNV